MNVRGRDICSYFPEDQGSIAKGKRSRGARPASEVVRPFRLWQGARSPVTGGSRGYQGSSPLGAGEHLVHTLALATDFLAANAPAIRPLVEKLAKSWSLAPADSAELLVVNKEQVAMVEVRLSLLPVILGCQTPLN